MQPQPLQFSYSLQPVKAFVFLAFICLLGCESKPSIVGTWESSYSGDNYGKSTMELGSDGTYRMTSDSGITSRNFRMRTSEEGTYSFSGRSLSTMRTSGQTEVFNPDGTVKRIVQQNPTTTNWRDVRLAGSSLTLPDPDAISTGDPPTTYKRR
jgi:hypothetical protein